MASSTTKQIKPMSTRIRLTKSLLDAWEWAFLRDDGYEDFLCTLNREKKPPTQAMLDGTQFESCVNGVLDGNEIDKDHPWYKPVTQMAKYLKGSQQQVVLFRDITVDGQDYLMHGVLDYLRAGVIYDCKFTKNYHLNKYLLTSQTPVYMYLVPEARRMEYLVSDGKYLYKESYPRDIVQPLDVIIRQFANYCKIHGLWETLAEKWRADTYGRMELPER